MRAGDGLAGAALTAIETDAVRRLGPVLSATGYAWHYALVTGLGETWFGPFADDAAAAVRRLASLPEDCAALAGLLALGRPARLSRLPAEFLCLVPALTEARLGRHLPGGRWQTDGWVAVPLFGGYLLADRPRAYGGSEVRVYLGPDSVILGSHVPQTRGLRVLDMGCGTGMQGILSVPDPAEACLVDLDERAVRLAALNAVLNGTGERTRCLWGDLYEPVAGEAFDLIVALPPYVPDPEITALSSVANGGADGLAVIRRLLRGAAAHLRPGGRLLALCQLLGTTQAPLLARELPDLAPALHCRLDVKRSVPAEALVRDLCRALAHGRDVPAPAALAASYRSRFASLGATTVHTAFLHADLA